MDYDEQEMFFDIHSELFKNKELIEKIKNKDEKIIKNICKYANGRLFQNSFRKIYNNILKKDNWTTKQRRFVLLQLINNVSNDDLIECVKKGDDSYVSSNESK